MQNYSLITLYTGEDSSRQLSSHSGPNLPKLLRLCVLNHLALGTWVLGYPWVLGYLSGYRGPAAPLHICADAKGLGSPWNESNKCHEVFLAKHCSCRTEQLFSTFTKDLQIEQKFNTFILEILRLLAQQPVFRSTTTFPWFHLFPKSRFPSFPPHPLFVSSQRGRCKIRPWCINSTAKTSPPVKIFKDLTATASMTLYRSSYLRIFKCFVNI